MDATLNQAKNECSKPTKDRHIILKSEIKDLTLLSFKKQLDACIEVFSTGMREQAWFEGRKPHDAFLQAELKSYKLVGEQEVSSHFVPFVQKVIVPDTSKIITLGDIHGDLDALLEVLTRLQDSGILNTEYQLTQKNMYLVGLGDYINRGPSSIPVLYVLSKLVIQNPGHVFLVRGNHEYALASKSFQKRFKQAQKDGEDFPAQSTLLDELSERFSEYVYPDCLYWFDFLPLSVFIGCKDLQGTVNYTQYTHAGIEIGYNPKKFLHDTQAVFECIDKLDRKQALQALCASDEKVNADVSRALEFCEQSEFAHFSQMYLSDQPIDMKSSVSAFHTRLGMQWGFFLAEENNKIACAISPQRRALYLGEKMAKQACVLRSTRLAQVISIIRGHQHLDESIQEVGLDSPMLTKIRVKNGHISQWGGLVHTLGASHEISGNQSFIIISLAQNISDWNVQHFYKKPENVCFSMKMTPFFSV